MPAQKHDRSQHGLRFLRLEVFDSISLRLIAIEGF
jgi:hypothetical protein